MIINKGSMQYKGWYTNLTATMVDYHFSFSPNGWTDDAVALKWLTELFEPCTASIVPIPQLLTLDGHGSHITWEFVSFWKKKTSSYSGFHHTQPIFSSPWMWESSALYNTLMVGRLTSTAGIVRRELISQFLFPYFTMLESWQLPSAISSRPLPLLVL